MRILWILPYSPWPTTSGGKTRQYHLLRSLAARGHRITVLLHSKQPVSAEDRQALEPFLERLVVLPRRPLRSLSTLLAALFAPYPLLASVNGLSAELQRTATELLREPWDVVQVEHSYSFQPYERPLRDAGQPFVLTEHNVESSLGAATYDRLPGWALPFVRYDQWRYRRWERRVMSQAAAVVAVTEKDARQLGAMLGRPVPVVVNGVDCEHFAAARPTPEAQRVLFLGNYEYAPNVDAVEWMLDEILPRVWAHCPEARMSVCGYALPAEWAQRWSDPRIEWQGFVPDLLQLQSSSSVFLAALRHGGGSKLKVLEALAAGLPLASTAQGVSGLELRDGEDYLGGESAEQLANAVVRLLQDPAQARALGRTAAPTYVARTTGASPPANWNRSTPASPKERRHAHRTRLPHRRQLAALGHQPPGLCHGAGPGKPARHAGDPLHRGPSRRPAAPAGGLPVVGLPAHRDAPAAPAPALRSRVPPTRLARTGHRPVHQHLQHGPAATAASAGRALCAADPRSVPDHPEELPRQPPQGTGLSDQRLPVDRLCAACRRPCLDPFAVQRRRGCAAVSRVAGKVRVLPNQVDGFAGEPADLSARGLPPRYWLLVGTRELRKNVPWFVSAWTRARAQAPGVPPLVLVGSLDHLPEEQRGLPGLHALGGLDDAELHALYRQAERLWQPSYAEGFGLPVVEALSVGTPVAVASGTSLDEVTPPSAPRFSPSDGAALERLMLRLADAPREASAEELIAWAARFNREAYRQRLAALIEELS